MGGIITLTTDFGLGEYVGAMKGAILSVDADLTIVDLDHNVRPHDIRHGAYVLYCAVPYYPFAAHVGVVDPGVGTKRRAIVCVCEGAYLVGPDNGLLVPAARRLGLKEVRDLEAGDERSPTARGDAGDAGRLREVEILGHGRQTSRAEPRPRSTNQCN